MNKTVYLICGVPGSGKSWVCNQVKDQFTYIEHDKAPSTKMLARTAANKAQESTKPLLIDCPFNETEVRHALKVLGLQVTPVFIVEHPDKVNAQYSKREGKPTPANVLTRASSIANKAHEWNALSGTSKQILEYLKNV